MFWASAARNHPDELRADMQAVYGIDIDSVGRTCTLRHAAALAAQLPESGRLKRAIDPALRWGEAEYMLSSIEYSLRVLLWRETRDAKRGANRPKPIPTPAEESELRRKLEATDVGFVNSRLKEVIGHGG